MGNTQVAPRHCLGCGISIAGRMAWARYCSDSCKSSARIRKPHSPEKQARDLQRRRERMANEPGYAERLHRQGRARRKPYSEWTAGEIFQKRFRDMCRKGYTGNIEEYAHFLECWRLSLRGEESWDTWLRKQRPARVAQYQHLSDAEYYRLKYSSRLEFRLKERMRRQFYKWLKGERSSVPSFMRSLHYSITELRAHLEALFEPGMSWENFGEWHVDHIVPKNLFDPQSAQETAQCWALSNLRPLWANDNLRRPKDGSDTVFHGSQFGVYPCGWRSARARASSRAPRSAFRWT